MKNKLLLLAGIAGAAVIVVKFSSYVSIPRGAHAVKPFDQEKYLGRWYEIARMDFKFEKNLE